MRTAGVVLDFYDDLTGEVVRSTWPTQGTVPEIVKEAHYLSPEEREILRDEGYALILENEGKVLRKFACVDEGNTLLSALYLERTHEKLPAEAVKVAAVNILEAFDRFELPVPAFLKVAAKTGMGRKRDPMQQAYAGEDADWAQRTNLNSVQGNQPSGRVAESAAVLKTAGVFKEGYYGDVGGHVSHVGGEVFAVRPGHPDNFKGSGQFNMHLYDKSRVDREMQEIHRRKTKEASARRIDVSGLEPEVRSKTKAASRTALDGRYALDAFSDVEAAVRYFDDHYVDFTPPERHEYAVKTASRADELGIQTSAILDRYGGTEFAPDIDGHLASRKAIVQDPALRNIYVELQEKRAAFEPEQFAQALTEADELAGLNWYWGGEVSDPYFATFGGRGVEKRAGWTWNSGTGEFVNEQQLKELSLTGREALEKTLSKEAIDAFQKNPVQIFESLPLPMKVVISRMAVEANPGLTQA